MGKGTIKQIICSHRLSSIELFLSMFIFCYTDSDMEWFVVHCEKKTYAIYIAL